MSEARKKMEEEGEEVAEETLEEPGAVCRQGAVADIGDRSFRVPKASPVRVSGVCSTCRDTGQGEGTACMVVSA